MKAKLGIGSVAWWNDDLPDLSVDLSLEGCMHEAASAGFTGMETGNRFPMSFTELGPVLERSQMSICGGWFSGELLDGDLERDKDRIAAQIAFFKAAGAPCINYGETARSIQGIRTAPLSVRPCITEADIAAYGRKLSDFAEWCAGQGMPLAYHHHMGAVIQTEVELDLLMRHSSVPLLLDTGHLAVAGGDALRVIENHHKRIIHVHAKDVREKVLNALEFGVDSFLDAVIKGVFTVPGDGDLDFAAAIQLLAHHGYQGWFVIEAEQDPRFAPPLDMARKGYTHLQHILAEAGYGEMQ